jgi:CRISPR-associated protein Csb2
MLVVEFRFPSSRYHATPWDAHVNEGEVEWPPSPWRLLRALVAVWHRKLAETVALDLFQQLLAKLAAVEPVYEVPSATVGSHTRHYMPAAAGARTKIFDAFLHLGREQSLRVGWPVSLAPPERQAMSILVESLGYLGRAESWIEGRLVDAAALQPNVQPLDPELGVSEREEIVRLLAPQRGPDYEGWRERELERRGQVLLRELRDNAAAKGKKLPERLPAAKLRKLETLLPTGLQEVLHADTKELRKRGWSLPPGARWVEYVRPLRTPPQVQAGETRDLRARFTVARFALTSSVPPHLTDTLSVADRLHTTLVKYSGSPVFTGQRDGRKREEQHAHAFILPEANGSDGRITHITVCAREGFDLDTLRALERVRWLWGRDAHDLQLVLLGVGSPSDFAGANRVAGQCPLLHTARVWQSRTPFISTSFPKLTRRGERKYDANGIWRGSPEHDLRRILNTMGLLERLRGVSVVDSTRAGGQTVRWLQFFLDSRAGKGGRRGPSLPTGFRLTFSEPISGPLALGYGAHFGLGLFEPVE